MNERFVPGTVDAIRDCALTQRYDLKYNILWSMVRWLNDRTPMLVVVVALPSQKVTQDFAPRVMVVTSQEVAWFYADHLTTERNP